jgi:hypothetical protein
MRLRCRIQFVTAGEQGKIRKSKQIEACRTGVLAAPAIRLRDATSCGVPLNSSPRLLCCHGRHVADPNGATSFTAWQRATRSGRE